MDFSCEVGGLKLRTPIIISSGVWPFDPELWRAPYADGVGAICTKGLTLAPREGNAGIRIWEVRGGLLNSIGLENPGVEGFVKEYLPKLENRNVALIVNLWAGDLEELKLSLRILKDYKSEIDALELNVSCPNVGSKDFLLKDRLLQLKETFKYARGTWDKPLWVKLSPMSPNVIGEALIAQEEGANAIVLANTWLGMAIDIEGERPVFERITAGLSGPAIFPLTLRLVWEVSDILKIDTIGCGGISSWEDAVSMLLAGASAIEMGTITFLELNAPSKVLSGMEGYLRRKGYRHFKDIIGKAKGGKLL